MRDHYSRSRSPLLLAALGLELNRKDAWPTDRRGRSLKQLIADLISPELQTASDPGSPAYVAVFRPEDREVVDRAISLRRATPSAGPALGDLARPVLLAFCVHAQAGAPVYLRRRAPFRYWIGTLPPDMQPDYVPVEPEYRRPGLKVGSPGALPPADRMDLVEKIANWATVHGIDLQELASFKPQPSSAYSESGSALERLLAAQPADLGRAIVIPADIALALSRMR